MEQIDADISVNGNKSEMGLAVSDFNSCVAKCAVDLMALTDDQCTCLELALKLYGIYRYFKCDLDLYRKKSECTEDDYKKLYHYKNKLCDLLKRIDPNLSICVLEVIDGVCSEHTNPTIPDVFGCDLVDGCDTIAGHGKC